jgi:hypothetical protein
MTFIDARVPASATRGRALAYIYPSGPPGGGELAWCWSRPHHFPRVGTFRPLHEVGHIVCYVTGVFDALANGVLYVIAWTTNLIIAVQTAAMNTLQPISMRICNQVIIY